MIAPVKKQQRKPNGDSTSLLTNEQAAKLINVQPRTLEGWRYNQIADQPRFIKYPGKRGKVRYRRQDIEAWLETRTREF